MSRMSLEEKVGQLFIQNVYGKDATTPDSRNLPLYGVASPAEVVKKYHLGGVIYFAWTDSVQNPDQIVGLSNGLQRAALTQRHQGAGAPPDRHRPGAGRRHPHRAARDAVPRLDGPRRRPQRPRRAHRRRDHRPRAARDGRQHQLRTRSATSTSTRSTPSSARGPSRRTRTLAAELVAAQVAGYQRDGGVSSSAKHFPGHGDTATDSHVAFPIITHTRAQWESIDAPPFKAAINEGIDMIMTAHLAFPALDDSGDPATLSKPIITGVLRDELGYDGVIVTDSLGMQGVRDLYGDAEVAVRALLAGVDQLLMTPRHGRRVCRRARLPCAATASVPSELDAKVRRVLRLKYRRGRRRPAVRRPGRACPPSSARRRTSRAADSVTDRTTTLVKNDAGALPLAPSGKKVLVTGYGVSTTATLAAALTAKGATVRPSRPARRRPTPRWQPPSPRPPTRTSCVVTTMKAWDTKVTDTRGGQQKLVKQLLATGKTVIVVAVRDPYDIAYFTAAPTYVATYSYSPVAIEAVARVITGDVSARRRRCRSTSPSPATRARCSTRSATG